MAVGLSVFQARVAALCRSDPRPKRPLPESAGAGDVEEYCNCNLAERNTSSAQSIFADKISRRCSAYPRPARMIAIVPATSRSSAVLRPPAFHAAVPSPAFHAAVPSPAFHAAVPSPAFHAAVPSPAFHAAVCRRLVQRRHVDLLRVCSAAC